MNTNPLLFKSPISRCVRDNNTSQNYTEIKAIVFSLLQTLLFLSFVFVLFGNTAVIKYDHVNCNHMKVITIFCLVFL